jgi:hypothetical protein
MSNKINRGEAYDFKTQYGQNVSNIILRIEWISNKNNLYAPIDISCVLLNGWGHCVETINYENCSFISYSGDFKNCKQSRRYPHYKLEGAGREFVLRFEEGHLEN